jgi:hypothetical protein
MQEFLPARVPDMACKNLSKCQQTMAIAIHLSELKVGIEHFRIAVLCGIGCKSQTMADY